MSVADEDTSSISSSSEGPDDDDDDDQNPPPLKKTKRSRDSGDDSEVDAPSRPRDPYERLHRQMITVASQLKKLQEQCKLCTSVKSQTTKISHCVT